MPIVKKMVLLSGENCTAASTCVINMDTRQEVSLYVILDQITNTDDPARDMSFMLVTCFHTLPSIYRYDYSCIPLSTIIYPELSAEKVKLPPISNLAVTDEYQTRSKKDILLDKLHCVNDYERCKQNGCWDRFSSISWFRASIKKTKLQ